MKKTLFLFGFILLIYISIGKASAEYSLDKAIRLRVLANSNSEYDQNMKNQVKEAIQQEMSVILSDTNDLKQARKNIVSNLDSFDHLLSNVLAKNGHNINYSINYGLNYFPEKKYNSLTFKEGEYESLLITLGEGNGDNFWCVLFPPFCLIEAEEGESIEYKSLVDELIKKYF